MSNILVTLREVKKFFVVRENVHREVLVNVNLTIHDHDWVVISGPSGSGKTTLLKVITGELLPNDGQVILNDSLKKMPSKIVYIPQEPQLPPYHTVLESLLSLNDEPHLARNLLQQLGMKHLMDSYPDELSRGETVRVSLCRALMLRPKLLLIDEPTANLDLDNSVTVIKMLKMFWEQNDITLVIVSHSKLVHARSPRHYILDSGKLVLVKGKSS